MTRDKLRFQRSRYARYILPSALVLLALAAFACQSSSPTPAASFPTAPPAPTLGALPTRAPLSVVQPTPQGGLNVSGLFAFVSNDGNLKMQDVKTGAVSVLVPTAPKGYPQYPAFSPDGQRVAYVYNSFDAQGNVHSELHIINSDKSGDKALVSIADPTTALAFPAWSPDGKQVYVTKIYPVPPSDQKAEIDRIPASGGQLATVIADGYESHLSPDGAKILFQRVDFTTYNAGLWMANSDGTIAKQLVATGAFSAVYGARFSPDASVIVFAASGPPRLALPGWQGNAGSGDRMLAQGSGAIAGATQGDGCYFSLLGACLVGRAEAHGLPWDLWLVDPQGTKFQRLTQIGADSPVPVWSTDGKYIAFFEATGIYLMDSAGKAIYRMSDYGGYGGFDWR